MNRGGRAIDEESDQPDKIREEIKRILSEKHGLTQADIAQLYQKYRNNEHIVDAVFSELTKKHKKVKLAARNLAEKVYRRYGEGHGSRPLHEILDKMMHHKKEQGWNDVEFDTFRNELVSLLTGTRANEVDNNQWISYNRSRINRVLGSNIVIAQDTGLSLNDEERPIVSDILAMCTEAERLHSSVSMRTLLYRDCDIVAMTGTFDRRKDTPGIHIPAFIAAMFLPKLGYFNHHMIYASIGNIIRTRHNKKPIDNAPDFLLYQDITTDPNDVVCSVTNPMMDLKHRFNTQIKLWQAVSDLRNGQYYSSSGAELIKALDACRNNIYDNADLSFQRDEGAYLRKLLSVFGSRPTIISSKIVESVATLSQSRTGFSLSDHNAQASTGVRVNYGNPSFISQTAETITTLPMIVIDVPEARGTVEPLDLRTTLSQNVWINEKGSMVPKEKTVIYSKEVLIFYVNRTIQKVKVNSFVNPINFSRLPLTIGNFSRLNAYPISVPQSMTVGRDIESYDLRSVVAASSTQIADQQLITGSVALITSHSDPESGVFGNQHYIYDPTGAAIPIRHPDADKDGWFNNKPVSIIDPYFSTTPDAEGNSTLSFYERASTMGSIYIYAKSGGYNPSESIDV